MPVLLFLVLVALIATFGFRDTLAAILGGVAAVAALLRPIPLGLPPAGGRAWPGRRRGLEPVQFQAATISQDADCAGKF